MTRNTPNLFPILTVGAVLTLALASACGGGGDRDRDRGPSPLMVEPIEIPLDEIVGAGEASLARNMFFIFDGSGSMGDEPGRGCEGDRSFRTKLGGAKWALQQFMSKVPEDINIGLYVFDDSGRGERTPLGTGNREHFLEAVQGIRSGQGTPLAASIRYGADRLVEQYKRQLGYGQYRLVVVTDGLADDIPDAARYAARHGIPIYAIGLCIGEDHPLRRYAVSYRAADSFEDLQHGLEETLAELPSFDAVEFEQAGR